MKKALLVCMLCLSIGFIFHKDVLAAGTKGEKSAMVKPTGADLWEHLQKEDYRKSWKMWPGKAALYPGKEPHGSLLTTYVNDVAYKAITEKKGVLPEGAIVAKENYSGDKKYMALTVMYKVKGYNTPANDWFWVKYTPEGKIEAEGKSDMCIKCHGQKQDNDYIWTGPLK